MLCVSTGRCRLAEFGLKTPFFRGRRTRFPWNPSGNLDERASDALVWELFLQAGPVGAFSAVSQLRS